MKRRYYTHFSSNNISIWECHEGLKFIKWKQRKKENILRNTSLENWHVCCFSSEYHHTNIIFQSFKIYAFKKCIITKEGNPFFLSKRFRKTILIAQLFSSQSGISDIPQKSCSTWKRRRNNLKYLSYLSGSYMFTQMILYPTRIKWEIINTKYSFYSGRQILRNWKMK